MTLEIIAQESSGGSPLGLIILLLPIAAIIFLTVVPQRRQKAKQQELMSNIAVGDEVVSIGGIHGVVNHIEDDVVHLEVDDDVVIKMGLGAIGRKASEPDPNSASGRRGGGLLAGLMGGAAQDAAGSGGDSEGRDSKADDGDSGGSADGAGKED